MGSLTKKVEAERIFLPHRDLCEHTEVFDPFEVAKPLKAAIFTADNKQGTGSF